MTHRVPASSTSPSAAVRPGRRSPTGATPATTCGSPPSDDGPADHSGVCAEVPGSTCRGSGPRPGRRAAHRPGRNARPKVGLTASVWKNSHETIWPRRCTGRPRPVKVKSALAIAWRCARASGCFGESRRNSDTTGRQGTGSDGRSTAPRTRRSASGKGRGRSTTGIDHAEHEGVGADAECQSDQRGDRRMPVPAAIAARRSEGRPRRPPPDSSAIPRGRVP